MVNFFFSYLFEKRARTCNRRCQYSSMINILCAVFWVPSRVIHIIQCSQHPELFVLTWLCRRSCWRACRFGWFSIFWINSRTLVLCASFTTECGNPWIRKSMSASFTIIDSWLTLRNISSTTLNVSLSGAKRVWELSNTSITSCVITSSTVLSCACSTLKSSLSSDERVWITPVWWTGFPGMGPVTSPSVRSPDNGTCFFHLACHQVAPISDELD